MAAVVSVTDVREVLRPGLLEAVTAAVAGPPRAALAGALEALGATLRPLHQADEDALAGQVARAAPLAALVVDAGALFDRPAPAGPALGAPEELTRLRAAADGAWAFTRAVANAAWIGPGQPGRAVFVAPRPGAGPHAGAARDALENLARTLSIEWSRFGIRTVAVTPGERTADAEVATVVAYLLSPAGDYFSGCRLDLS